MNDRGKPALEPVVLGRVSGLYGIRGWVRIHSYTDPREALLEYGPWSVGHAGGWRALPMAEGRRQGKAVIARLAGYNDRDQAAELIGQEIAVPPEALPAPGEGRYYWRDLEGLEVRHRDGTSLGRVAGLMETGAHDVLVISGERERLVPFVPGVVVLDVDIARGVILVDWEWD